MISDSCDPAKPALGNRRRAPSDSARLERRWRSLSNAGWSIACATAALVVCLSFGAPALAQRELRIRVPTEAVLPYVTTVVAPLARHAVVSDVARVLAVGHRPRTLAASATTPAGMPHPQLTLIRLTDQGGVAPGDPIKVTLPKPAALGERPNHVLSLAAHPTFPLLYVWQDVPALPDPQTLDQALGKEFDHLLVYDVAENPPKLILSTCRGDGYNTGTDRGSLAVDKPARRLYVPNMRTIGPMKKPVAAIGWLRLAPDGLPVFAETKEFESPALEGGPAGPALDAAGAAAARAARLAAFEKARSTPAPLVPSRYAEPSTYSFAYYPAPYDYSPISDDAVLLAGHSGAVSWKLDDRLGRYGYHILQPGIPYRYRLTAHPTLPCCYYNIVTYDGRLVRLEHADGHFTLTPQQLGIDNAVFHSRPVVVAPHSQLVMGAVGRVVAVSLAPDGKLTEKATQMTVENPTVEALAWSDKFGKLYVPVEK